MVLLIEKKMWCATSASPIGTDWKALVKRADFNCNDQYLQVPYLICSFIPALVRASQLKPSVVCNNTCFLCQPRGRFNQVVISTSVSSVIGYMGQYHWGWKKRNIFVRHWHSLALMQDFLLAFMFVISIRMLIVDIVW